MAEPDIVAEAREAVAQRGWGQPRILMAMLTQAADEIERLRGGWTRLGPGSLPPQHGTPFELRHDVDPGRYFLAWSPTYADWRGSYFTPTGDCTDNAFAPCDLLHLAGWWRLLPGGEPPTDG